MRALAAIEPERGSAPEVEFVEGQRAMSFHNMKSCIRRVLKGENPGVLRQEDHRERWWKMFDKEGCSPDGMKRGPAPFGLGIEAYVLETHE